MKTMVLLALVALLGTSRAAGAQNLSCVSGYASLNCTLSNGGFGPAKIIHVAPRAFPDEEADDAFAKWEDFCKPRIVQRAPDYVRRYAYAHPGCEVGRSQ